MIQKIDSKVLLNVSGGRKISNVGKQCLIDMGSGAATGAVGGIKGGFEGALIGANVGLISGAVKCVARVTH